MIEIVTAGGRHLTATPNHPMLSRHGWLGAGEITEGDDLICDNREQNFGVAGDADVQTPPPTIAEIFDAAAAVSVAERKLGSRPDFHGDGQEAEIDILCPDRFLRVGDFAPLYKPLVQDVLAGADPTRAALCHRCDRLLSVQQQRCLCDGADMDPRIREATEYQLRANPEFSGNEFGRHAAGVPSHNVISGDVLAVAGLAILDHPAPRFAARAAQAEPMYESPDPFLVGSHVRTIGVHRDRPGHLGKRAAVGVELDRVISVNVRMFTGHVYNLSTPYGYFTIENGVFTGNTAHAYGAGTLRGGKEAGAREKRSVTAGDSAVCMSCIVNEEEGWIPIDSDFPSGDDAPDFHVLCRCELLLRRGPEPTADDGKSASGAAVPDREKLYTWAGYEYEPASAPRLPGPDPAWEDQWRAAVKAVQETPALQAGLIEAVTGRLAALGLDADPTTAADAVAAALSGEPVSPDGNSAE